MTNKGIQNLKPFKKGWKGGPGRPKGTSVSKQLQKLLDGKLKHQNPETGVIEDRPGSEWIAIKLLYRALEGEGDMRAIKEVIDRSEGLPRQHITQENVDISLDDYLAMPDDEFNAHVKKMAESQKKT